MTDAQSASLPSDDAFETLKRFFETAPASHEAIGALKKGSEIAVSIGGAIDCALFQEGGRAKIEKRPARRPDFAFTVRPETVYVLAKEPSAEIADVGIAVMKEILAGNVSVRMTGNILSVLSGGYLEILKRGGSKFAATLAAHGLVSANRVMAAIKKMRAS